MNRFAWIRALIAALLATVVVIAGLHAPPATAALAEPTQSAPPIPVPPLVTEVWNGTTGVVTINERWRKMVADVAELTEHPEVRDAALAALASADSAAIRKFVTVEKPRLENVIMAREHQQDESN